MKYHPQHRQTTHVERTREDPFTIILVFSFFFFSFFFSFFLSAFLSFCHASFRIAAKSKGRNSLPSAA